MDDKWVGLVSRRGRARNGGWAQQPQPWVRTSNVFKRLNGSTVHIRWLEFVCLGWICGGVVLWSEVVARECSAILY